MEEEMQRQQPGMKLVEQCKISPAPGSAAPEILPFTFFDYISMVLEPVERVFFYQLPCSVADFLILHLPQLKLSLSLALRDFRPLAGSLHRDSDTSRLEIRSSDLDAVSLTVAESGDDFHDLSANHARTCARFRPLVPPVSPWPAMGQPLLALQLTLFPNAGVVLGISVSHAVADGTTTAHFLKAWAAACRRGMGGDDVVIITPSYDRSAQYLSPSVLDAFCAMGPAQDTTPQAALDIGDRKDVVLSTFCFSREQTEKLREEFSRKTGTAECSSFALVSGFMWACLAKAEGDSSGKTNSFGFGFEARARLDPPLPATYFGNCVGVCWSGVGGSELKGENGAFIASKEIWKSVRGLKSMGAIELTMDSIRALSTTRRNLSPAGSPRLGMYQVDFGWGRPRKVEIISVEKTGALAISEWGEDGRGLEIGLALPRDLLGKFSAIVADCLA